MTRPIGLTAGDERIWDGSLRLEFTFVKLHASTARYKAPFKTRPFDIYVPLLALPEEHRSSPPYTLQGALGPSASAVSKIGFGAGRRSLELSVGVCEFDFAETMVNYVQYRMPHEQQVFRLYVPYDAFDGKPHPRRVFLQLGEK
jgi:hypothetical protein